MFRSNDVFQRKYTEFIDDLFVKVHASTIPVDDLSRDDGKVWYRTTGHASMQEVDGGLGCVCQIWRYLIE